eukprot:TRINITY_DN6007_c0_g1_i9.p1 TRINITY_DN6007_c0_g1~~TRINITY_DN6007_c0_g1_i9.p1  ORF type:complete len:1911 (+),score=581.76 TRINITY_DN6007_c0_g1_i9:126-5858(+)
MCIRDRYQRRVRDPTTVAMQVQALAVAILCAAAAVVLPAGPEDQHGVFLLQEDSELVKQRSALEPMKKASPMRRSRSLGETDDGSLALRADQALSLLRSTAKQEADDQVAVQQSFAKSAQRQSEARLSKQVYESAAHMQSVHLVSAQRAAAALEQAEQRGAKENGRKSSEIARSTQAVDRSKAMVRLAKESVKNATLELDKDRKRAERQVSTAEQLVEQASLNVSLASQRRLVTKVEAQKQQMEADAASVQSGERLAEFGAALRQKEAALEAKLAEAERHVNSAHNAARLGSQQLVQAQQDAKSATDDAVVETDATKQMLLTQKHRVSQTRSRLSASQLRHQQDSAAASVTLGKQTQVQESLKEERADKDKFGAELDAARSALWAVEKEKSRAKLLEKKVGLDRGVLESARSSRTGLVAEQSRITVLRDAAARGQVVAKSALKSSTKAQLLADESVSQGVDSVRAAVKRWKQLQLDAEQVASDETRELASMERVSTDMKKAALHELQQTKHAMRNVLNQATASAVGAQAGLAMAQQGSTDADAKLEAARARLVQIEHDTAGKKMHAEAVARKRTTALKTSARLARDKIELDAKSTLNEVLDDLNLRVGTAKNQQTDAESTVQAAQSRIKDAAAIRAGLVEQATMLAEREIAAAKGRVALAKKADAAQVEQLLEQAQNSQVNNLMDPEEKASQTAKLQAYAESAQELASSDGQEIRQQQQQLEIDITRIKAIEDDSIQQAKRDESKTVSQAERDMAGARAKIAEAQQEIADAHRQRDDEKQNSASHLQQILDQERRDERSRLEAVANNLEEDQRKLVGATSQAQETVAAAEAHATQASDALEKAASLREETKKVLAEKQQQNAQLLERAHAKFSKAEQTTAAELQVRKAKLTAGVVLARERANQAQGKIGDVRQALVKTRAVAFAAAEQVQAGKRELDFHKQSGDQASDLLESIDSKLKDASQRVSRLQLQLDKTVHEAALAQTSASGDSTVVELRHERAKKEYQAAVDRLAQAESTLSQAQAEHSSVAEVAAQSHQLTNRLSNQLTIERGRTARLTESFEQDQHQANGEVASALAKVAAARNSLEGARETQEKARVSYQAVGKSLGVFREQFEASIEAKQKQIQVGIKKQQELATKAAQADTEALRAMDKTTIAKEQAQAKVEQAKLEGAESNRLEAAYLDRAKTRLGLAQAGLVRKQSDLSTVEKSAREAAAANKLELDRVEVSKRQEDLKVDKWTSAANTNHRHMLQAQQLSTTAAERLAQAQQQAGLSKNALAAATRESRFAQNELAKAREQAQQERRHKATAGVKEAASKALKAAGARDQAVAESQDALNKLPALLAASKQHAEDAQRDAQAKHADRIKMLHSRAEEQMAMASKRAEIAGASMIQAQMSLTKAQDAAEHTTKKSQAQIELAKSSAEQAKSLADGRVQAADRKKKRLEAEAGLAANQVIEQNRKTSAALAAKNSAAGGEGLAMERLQAARSEAELATTQKKAQVAEALDEKKRFAVQLAAVSQDVGAWETRSRTVGEDAARIKLRLAEAGLAASEAVTESEIKTKTAKLKSGSESQAALEKATLARQSAQMKLEAARRESFLKLKMVRSAAAAKRGEMDVASIAHIQAIEASSELEIKNQQSREEDAIHRQELATHKLELARDARLEASGMQHKFELVEKQHALAIIRTEKLTKAHELQIKSEEQEADAKHQAKLQRIELDSKAIDKARSAEREAKEVYSKSTKAPTRTPTREPTNTPSSSPTRTPTEAPTLPQPCITPEPTPKPTADPTSAPTSDPTIQPTMEPTNLPTSTPTSAPTTPQPTQARVGSRCNRDSDCANGACDTRNLYKCRNYCVSNHPDASKSRTFNCPGAPEMSNQSNATLQLDVLLNGTSNRSNHSTAEPRTNHSSFRADLQLN